MEEKTSLWQRARTKGRAAVIWLVIFAIAQVIDWVGGKLFGEAGFEILKWFSREVVPPAVSVAKREFDEVNKGMVRAAKTVSKERGDAAYNCGDYKNALTEYADIAKWDAKDPIGPYLVGLTYAALGQRDKAERFYKRSINLCHASDLSLPAAWNNLGGIYFKRGEYVRARMCFEKAASEGDPDAKANLEVCDRKGITITDWGAFWSFVDTPFEETWLPDE